MDNLEEAKLNFFADQENIARIVYNHKCPTCSQTGWQDVQNIDFEKSKITHKCVGCGEVTETDLTPKSEIKKHGKKPKPPTAVGEIDAEGMSIKDMNMKIKEMEDKMSEMKDEDQKKKMMMKIEEMKKKKKIMEESLKLAKAKELEVTDLLERHEKGGMAVDELLKKYNQASIEELSKFIDETLASVKVKDEEIATLKKGAEDAKLLVENAKIELEKVQVEAKAVKDELDKRLAAEKAAFVKVRKDELGEEYAKDLTDEDITNDLKFENAKLKKELAIVKAKPASGGLEAGAVEHKPDDPVFKKQTRIQEQSFGKQ